MILRRGGPRGWRLGIDVREPCSYFLCLLDIMYIKLSVVRHCSESSTRTGFPSPKCSAPRNVNGGRIIRAEPTELDNAKEISRTALRDSELQSERDVIWKKDPDDMKQRER